MNTHSALSHAHRALRYALTVILLLLVSTACSIMLSHTTALAPAGMSAYAYAAESGLAAGSVDVEAGTQSSGFKASTTYLVLSPKVKKVPYGHKYIQVHKTVTIKIPNGYYPVTWKSSNPKVATAKESYKDNEMKLVVYSNEPGKSTITIRNSATYETVKIRVVVKGLNSKDFKTSETELDLSPRKKKLSSGYMYTSKSRSITVAAPDGASVTWKSSDESIADAEWSGKWNGNTTKLKIKGHRTGKATITLTNSKTKKKIKIKVIVDGYGLGMIWNTPVKKNYAKADGSTGYYTVNNFKLVNKTGETLKLDKKCELKVMVLNPNYEEEYEAWLDSDDENAPEPREYVHVNFHERIRGVPLKVKNGKSKVIYTGENEYLKGNESVTSGVLDNATLTVKIGKSYKTVQFDGYGMVTKVLNGRWR